MSFEPQDIDTVDNNTKQPKITIIMHFYNEEYLLPFWLNHHKNMFDHGVLIDYNSTDKSIDIIKKIVPHWTIVKSNNYDFDSGTCDLEVMEVERHIRGWKIALNVTEFLCYNNNLSELIKKYNNYDALVFKCMCMVESKKCEQNIPLDFEAPLVQQRSFGVKDEWRKTRTMHCSTHGNYNEHNDVGRHQPHVYPFIQIGTDEAVVLWYGFSPFNKEILKRKCQIKRPIRDYTPDGYYTEQQYIDEFEKYQSDVIDFRNEPNLSHYFTAPKLRIALCLRGISTEFEKSFDNINQYIVQDLRKKYDVDVFLNTYHSPILDNLVEKYNPSQILLNKFQNHDLPMYTLVSSQILECCQLIEIYETKYKCQYDVIIITRFDLTFNNKFSEYNIDYDAINTECMFVPDYNAGDNFILFPRKHLEVVKRGLSDNINNGIFNSHELYKFLGDTKCHYIGGETSKRGSDYDVVFQFTRYL